MTTSFNSLKKLWLSFLSEIFIGLLQSFDKTDIAHETLSFSSLVIKSKSADNGDESKPEIKISFGFEFGSAITSYGRCFINGHKPFSTKKSMIIAGSSDFNFSIFL